MNVGDLVIAIQTWRPLEDPHAKNPTARRYYVCDRVCSSKMWMGYETPKHKDGNPWAQNRFKKIELTS